MTCRSMFKCMQYAEIKSRIACNNAVVVSNKDCRQASVALLLRYVSESTEVFFIERAANVNDPWSGQVAFPGGNREKSDLDLSDTAIRETREEVGLKIGSQSFIGRLDDQQGRNNYRSLPLVISCFVFEIGSEQQPANNHEVEDSFWVSLQHLQNPDNQFQYQTTYSDDPYPAIRLDKNRVLWGLTYRFVEMFLKVAS